MPIGAMSECTDVDRSQSLTAVIENLVEGPEQFSLALVVVTYPCSAEGADEFHVASGCAKGGDKPPSTAEMGIIVRRLRQIANELEGQTAAPARAVEA
jgi:hypothetical protein